MSVPPEPGSPRAQAQDPGSRREPLAGRIALSIALLGLVGAALGGGWVAVSARLGLGPEGLAGGVAFVVAAGLLVVGVILMGGGLGFYVLAPGFMGPAAAVRTVGTHRLVIASTLLIVLAANAGPLAFASFAGADGLCSVPGFLTAALSVDAALIAVTYIRFIRPGVLTVADLGLRRDRLVRDVGLGLLVGVGVLMMSAAIQTVLQALGVRQTQLQELSCVRGFSPVGFLGIVIAGGMLAPLAEELYFRGFVFRSYLQVKGPWVAYLGTSLLFATLHLNLPALLPILMLSLVFCFAYHRTGSIVPSIVGHALNNTAAFGILYFTNAPL